MISSADVDALAQSLLSGDRRALARAITLVESTRDDDRDAADALLTRVLPSTGKAVRLGVSGTPGVGKSTFIEALGMHLVNLGLGGAPGLVPGERSPGTSPGAPLKVAVLAVDPSSPESGGSLLGDKTRMERLSRHANAFVRPSPSSGTLGGTAPHTRDAILLCEAAGFDVVIVETVGVGQSEHAVADLTDTFLLLVAPGGGDELQGVKRGILELVDVLVVNKADGSFLDDARKTRDDYDIGSRMFLRALANWSVPVLLASAKEGTGVADAWAAVERHRAALIAAGALDTKRAAQAERAMWRAVEDVLMRDLRGDASVQGALPSITANVRAATTTPSAAARALLRARTRA